MSSGKHPRAQIASAVVRLIEDSGSQPELARRIAAYLITEGRVKELDSLMRDVMRLRAARGTVEATTTSAFPLTEDVRKQIEHLVAAMQGSTPKQIMTNEVNDPTMLGGVRIETPQQQLDLTIRARLDRLKRYAALEERTNRGLIS